MKEYRIVKKSMFAVTGRPYFMFAGQVFCDVFCVQKKVWFGRWRNVKGATICMTLQRAETLMELDKQGKLTNKGYEVVE